MVPRYAVRTVRPGPVRTVLGALGASCPVPQAAAVRTAARGTGTRSPYALYGGSGTYVSAQGITGPTPTWSKAVKWAALEAAGSCDRGSGWVPIGRPLALGGVQSRPEPS